MINPCSIAPWHFGHFSGSSFTEVTSRDRWDRFTQIILASDLGKCKSVASARGEPAESFAEVVRAVSAITLEGMNIRRAGSCCHLTGES